RSSQRPGGRRYSGSGWRRWQSGCPAPRRSFKWPTLLPGASILQTAIDDAFQLAIQIRGVLLAVRVAPSLAHFGQQDIVIGSELMCAHQIHNRHAGVVVPEDA